MNDKTNPSETALPVKKAVRTMLLILGGVAAACLVVLLLLYWLLPEKNSGTHQTEIEFYPVIDQNIFESQEYLGLDRSIYYCEDPNGYGATEPITDEDREKFDIKVRFLEIFLKSVISGDNETYRSLFSPAYLAEHPLEPFTQQMLYNMHIYKAGSEQGKDGRTLYVYKLDYMIRKNNGTFRKDVGSDAVRSQFVVLSMDAERHILIENLYVKNIVAENR